jgi:transposase
VATQIGEIKFYSRCKTFPATENGGADFDGPNFADRHNDWMKQNPCLQFKPVTVDAVLLPAIAKRQRRVGRFERVHELATQGMPIRQIARELDMSRKSVRRYLHRERCPDWRPGRDTRSGLDAHREWIDARIAEGRINASKLHGELAAKGVRLSYGTVRRYLNKRLGRVGKVRSRVNAAKPKPTPLPSPRQLSFDWVCRPEKRTVEAWLVSMRSEDSAPI